MFMMVFYGVQEGGTCVTPNLMLIFYVILGMGNYFIEKKKMEKKDAN